VYLKELEAIFER